MHSALTKVDLRLWRVDRKRAVENSPVVSSISRGDGELICEWRVSFVRRGVEEGPAHLDRGMPMSG